ncbi:sulfotransferase family 2 domain-containing protein [Tateyamaria omphalii]|uniref:Sulfotransferase family protein n=1 Tax=Tateyamaria omphalii TaxID=299262 RepID=A0A1P8N229_9RHOB|nr:sulfotransferase family 2 domain-containing protein [Tateyamaria omphalii]APX14366.1 hypothetical protein BWR18_21245 [Tateyamaria omphalii]
MPIFRIGSDLGFFAHVPKCAGSSIETYLAERFGPLAFVDRAFREQSGPQRWTKSSPQHLPVSALERLFPPGFFACSFAVVRDPVDRLRSAFQVQRDVIGRIPRKTSFGAWLTTVEDAHASKPWYLDNHARPMDDLVPEEAVIFRLEDGLEPVVAWLDAQAGNADGPRQIGTQNTRADIFASRTQDLPPRPPVRKADRVAVARIFARDYARFGYDPEKEN